MTENLLGYEIYSDDHRCCEREICAWIRGGSNQVRWLACINPHSYVLAMKDSKFSLALRAADWLVPDGVGIVLASRALGGNIAERITGSDIFAGVMRDLNVMGGRVFFLGASEETLALLRSRVRTDFPSVQVVGTRSPPFKAVFSAEEVNAMILQINAAKPDVLWVGMTSPKQDLWIYANLFRLKVRFVAGIGAVFDFYAGQVRRSHPVFQRIGLEWLPRLLRQPRRLWRRMFVSAPIFLWHVFLNRLKS